MPNRVPSTIAQVLYPSDLELDFARIVSELETVLTRLGGCDAQLHWDDEDFVTFDLPEARVLLATAELGRASEGSCLTVSVGPSASAEDTDQVALPGDERRFSGLGGLDHATLCSRLVERVQGRFVPAAVLWQEVEGLVDVDMVDALTGDLPHMRGLHSRISPPQRPATAGAHRQDRPHSAAALMGEVPAGQSAAGQPRIDNALADKLLAPAFDRGIDRRTAARAMPAPLAVPQVQPLQTASKAKHPALRLFRDSADAHGKSPAANDVPDLPLPQTRSLQHLRAALYPEGEETADARPSTQIRLAAHCLNATLILVYAPLGAAVMTYALLKGEDIRFSARMMAVVGTVVGLAQTPIGHTVKAMASVQGWN